MNLTVASSDELIRNPRVQRPHVVILGAGASRAACPSGDRNGHRLPVMADFISVLDLDPLLARYGIDYAGKNFEILYSSLCSDESRLGLLREIESAVYEYFASLKLPDSPTIYDYLLLSLRRKDVVFTFNWDPLLYDAWVRNRHFHLPEIFFLHGNARVAYCASHGHWGTPGLRCPECSAELTPSRLLYPVAQKNYSSDPHISGVWESARWFLKNAFLLTIFGYGAPDSDIDAVNIMETAWRERGDRLVERVEIIDIESREVLYEKWKPFFFYHHYDVRRTFSESWIARYPRRSCEALYAPGIEGRPADQFPMPPNIGFGELYEWLLPVTGYESTPMA